SRPELATLPPSPLLLRHRDVHQPRPDPSLEDHRGHVPNPLRDRLSVRGRGRETPPGAGKVRSQPGRTPWHLSREYREAAAEIQSLTRGQVHRVWTSGVHPTELCGRVHRQTGAIAGTIPNAVHFTRDQDMLDQWRRRTCRLIPE